MRNFIKNFSVAMVLAGAALAAQAGVMTVDEGNVAVLESTWGQVKAKGVAGNEDAYKVVAVVADKLGKDRSQDVAMRASKVESEVKAALRENYVATLQKSLDSDFQGYFQVEAKRTGIVLAVKSDLMDEDLARHLTEKMNVQDDAFSKDYRKVEFVNEKTGFSQVVPNYKIPRVAS